MSGIQQVRIRQAARYEVLAEDADWPELAPSTTRMARPGLLLKETIEQDVLPHLLRLHPAQPALPDAREIEALARRAAFGDPELLQKEIASLLDAGAAADRVCLEVLAPAARRLGELWEEDEVDFVTVTIGVLRLQRALVRLMPADVMRQATARAPCILMVPVPGEQHQFGLLMASGMFRRAGWRVTSGLSPEIDTLRVLAETNFYDAIGFSASCERHAEMLARSISAVRRVSCNAELRIVVGGPLCLADPLIARQLGADLVATDSASAPHDLAALLPHKRDGLTAGESQPGAMRDGPASGEQNHSDRRATPIGYRLRRTRPGHDQEDHSGCG